ERHGRRADGPDGYAGRGRECRRIPRLGRQQLRHRDRAVRRWRLGPGLSNGWEQQDRLVPFEPDDQGRCDEWYARRSRNQSTGPGRARAKAARRGSVRPDLTTVREGDLSHGDLAANEELK